MDPTEPIYRGIKYPDRAESLRDRGFDNYRVFLDHWDDLSQKLRFFYEGLALRGETRAMLVHASQGSGKTMFASRLEADFRAREQETAGVDPQNLWDRMTGGSSNSSLHTTLATMRTSILSIENDKKWVETAKAWRKASEGRHCIVVVDNAERGYFLQSLLGLDDAQFLQLGKSPAAVQQAAENFVALARTDLRQCLFIILTNNDDFATNFAAGVADQHNNLLALEALPFPSHSDKETVIRTNINRLNPISYWYCLDKAGPEAKQKVFEAIRGEETYPGAFAAVDTAIKTADLSRVGRPANKCILSLVLLHPGNALPEEVHTWAAANSERSLSIDWLRITLCKDGWATQCLTDRQNAQMLESEWSLRIVSIGSPLVGALLSRAGERLDLAAQLLKELEVVHGTGTRSTTIEAYRQRLSELVGALTRLTPSPDGLETFWNKGQPRAADYEAALRTIYPTYNRSTAGFLQFYRPDLVVDDYAPCSVMAATSGDAKALTEAIRRRTHVFEFTAQKIPTAALLKEYLASKLQNYVRIMQEQ